MADNSYQPDHAPAAPGKEEKRAEKAQIKEQKRVERAAAKAQRDADLAKLEAETVGKSSGFWVFEDGTVQKEPSPETAMSSALTGWRAKLGESGLGGLVPEAGRPVRSAVVDVTLNDKRIRKPFARARAAMPSTGLVGSGRDHFGTVTLTITTRDWTEQLVASWEKDVAALMALNEMLLEAKSVAASGGDAASNRSQPAPPTPPVDVAAALRELKALHDEGLLTDDEFETRRQALLVHLPVLGQADAPSRTVAPDSDDGTADPRP